MYYKNYKEDSQELQNTTTSAFVTCAAKLTKMKNVPRPHNEPCPLRPNILLRCVYRTVFMKCPRSIWVASEDCDEMLKYFAQCI